MADGIQSGDKPTKVSVTVAKVVAIIDNRQNEDGLKEYLIKWDKNSQKQNSWQPITKLLDAMNLVIIFEGERHMRKKKLPEFAVSQEEVIRKKRHFNPGIEIVPAQKTNQQSSTTFSALEQITQVAPQKPLLHQSDALSPKPALKSILKKKSSEITQMPATTLQVQTDKSQDERKDTDAIKKTIIIDYICFKNGQHLYSLETKPGQKLLMTAQNIKKEYPREMIKFFQQKLRENYLNQKL